MTAEEAARELPELVPHVQAAKAIGICRRRILTEYIRLGLLPHPDGACRFRRDDIVAVIAADEAKRAAR